MRRVLAVLVALPLLSGCGLLARLGAPEEPVPVPSLSALPSLPVADVVATITLADGDVTWPEAELAPGDHRVDWVKTCVIELVVDGATLIRTDDPPSGSRTVTIAPGQSSRSLTAGCMPADSMTAVISEADPGA